MNKPFFGKSLGKIIAGTPTWVWAVFAYILYVGIRAIKPRNVSTPQLFIIPAIFIAMKFKAILSASFSEMFSYLACLTLAGALSYAITSTKQCSKTGRAFEISLPGTYSTLIVLLCFFAIQYVFGALKAINPALHQEVFIIEMALNGLLSGYFLGRAVRYLRYYYS